MLFKTQFDVHQTDFTLIVTDKFCLMSIIHCFVLFWFPFYFSVFVFFFSLQRWWWTEGEIFVSKCCCLLASFLYGLIVLIILTLTMFFMWMFAIDPITTNFKALLRCKSALNTQYSATIHCWTMNVMVVTYTINEILLICRKA